LQQTFVFVVLIASLGFFLWGRWRYDLVALAALLILVAAGIVDPERAFLGFGHPAVITVVAVLVVSRGLEGSGFAEWLTRALDGVSGRPVLQLSALTALVAVCSAFMNNVGALALFMPVAIRMARAEGRSSSLFLMPMAFGSLLGGLTTLIGTPPNIVIATFRAEHTGTGFGMFAFAPVGTAVAVAGVAFVTLVGWRLLPKRKGQVDEHFEIEAYLSEVRIPEGSTWVGRPLHEIVPALDVDVTVVGIVRGEEQIGPPFRREPLQVDDVLLLEAEPGDLDALVAGADLDAAGTHELMTRFLSSKDDVQAREAVVRPHSRFAGQTAERLQLRAGHGVNLLGVARQGHRIRGRLRDIAFQPGDVLLLQGTPEAIRGALATLGGLPLAERGVAVGRPRRLAWAVGVFAVAIGLTVAGLLPVQVALTAAALTMVAARVLSLQAAYESVQWPVIVLLAAMLPVGAALESTGGASSLAALILRAGGSLPPEALVAALLVMTMLLSNVINNTAAAVLMAPVAVALAGELGASLDPFLMAVAVGASCAFLTPIGHQSNTLVMGPGGYHFGDYLYLGLPLSALAVLVALPLILMVWPL
jgi:di/tricarboxylate transporter